jgi:hypothetical protein
VWPLPSSPAHSFKDGKLLNFLVHRAKPGSVDLNTANQGSALDTLKRAIALAEKELNIPVLIDPEDFINGSDERMLATYVSYFRNLRNNREVRAQAILTAHQRLRW